jgi:hypothetical protein
VIPTGSVTIPNAQMAVPATYGRSGVVGRARSGILGRAIQIATAQAAITARNAGQLWSGSNWSRIGAAAPAAP